MAKGLDVAASGPPLGFHKLPKVKGALLRPYAPCTWGLGVRVFREEEEELGRGVQNHKRCPWGEINKESPSEPGTETLSAGWAGLASAPRSAGRSDRELNAGQP